MNYQKIDIEESINKNRVVSKVSTMQTVDEFLVELALILPFPIMAGSFVFFEIQKFYSPYLTQAIILFILSAAHGGLIGYSLINNENLVRVNGKGADINRALIDNGNSKRK